MDIYRAEKIAQDRMAESRGDWDKKFTLIGPRGILNCEWLDPYFGFFTIEGHEGFLRTKDIPANVECVMPEESIVSD